MWNSRTQSLSIDLWAQQYFMQFHPLIYRWAAETLQISIDHIGRNICLSQKMLNGSLSFIFNLHFLHPLLHVVHADVVCQRCQARICIILTQ